MGPHAVTDKVKYLMNLKLRCSGIKVVSEGEIKAEVIDEKQLIDTHYGAIAAKAVKLKPHELNVQPKAQENFEKTFDAKWGPLKVGTSLLKFGGGFYCGKVDGIYVINGFYMSMRGAFTKPGTCIYYYQVEWDAKDLSWADFREKILGGTNPAKAYTDSARHLIYANWKGLGLKSLPNTGDNGVPASASPFEALSEKNNWLGIPLNKQTFGKGMLASGVPPKMLQAWCDDPQVSLDGKKQSLFDLLEDLNASDCLSKAGKIAAAN